MGNLFPFITPCGYVLRSGSVNKTRRYLRIKPCVKISYLALRRSCDTWGNAAAAAEAAAGAAAGEAAEAARLAVRVAAGTAAAIAKGRTRPLNLKEAEAEEEEEAAKGEGEG